MVALHCENIIILNHECKKYFASTDEIRICDLELTIIVMRFNQILNEIGIFVSMVYILFTLQNMTNNHLLTVFCCSMIEIEFLQNVCMGAEILLFVSQKNTK